MTEPVSRDALIASAARLTPPSAGALAEFTAHREALAARVNRAMAQRPDLEKLVGADGRRMSEDNNRNFALFMESLMGHFQPEVLADTALWVFRAYRAHGFRSIYWPANLNTWRESLEAVLSREAFEEIEPFYAWLITHIPVFTALTEDAGGG